MEEDSRSGLRMGWGEAHGRGESSRSEGMRLEGSKSEGRRVREGPGQDIPVWFG